MVDEFSPAYDPRKCGCRPGIGRLWGGAASPCRQAEKSGKSRCSRGSVGAKGRKIAEGRRKKARRGRSIAVAGEGAKTKVPKSKAVRAARLEFEEEDEEDERAKKRSGCLTRPNKP